MLDTSKLTKKEKAVLLTTLFERRDYLRDKAICWVPYLRGTERVGEARRLFEEEMDAVVGMLNQLEASLSL